MQFVYLKQLRLCRRCTRSLAKGLQRQCSRHVVSLQKEKKCPRNGGNGDTKNIPTITCPSEEAEPGPMARRLEEATEHVLLTGGVGGRRAVEDAGFSEELREKLLDKVAGAKFRQQYQGAFALADISPSTTPSSAGLESGSPWTGTENTADAVLRMLHDAHKPLKPGDRGKFQPPVVDVRIRARTPQSPGQRAVGARDKANIYASMGMKATKGLSEGEREEMKAELRERFQPAARAVPASISGLTALANQRIEDAIARGQFKDLPRGEKIVRDPRADNPFIDTTEYIMNKMIRRQEMVPPWIEKQQELTKAARVFRERLRNDWKRHVARMIASQGGSLEEQMKRATISAAAELAHNPRHLHGQTKPSDAVRNSTEQRINTTQVKDTPRTGAGDLKAEAPSVQRSFRDPDWVKTEQAYMSLSIEKLNSITRSYNLMAPELARKPYFSLERELDACYADVAPLVADEIKARAIGRKADMSSDQGATRSLSLVGKLIGKDKVKLHLEAEEKAYGLREWWRDFWTRK